ncbi:DUF4231 domain-containing protein [Alloacidobacterium sp.]|uniref:DUF4231 domain-containing protein n=1 Tax=Alloacidobacterium sp. TaxID=2951999 RepID=UPI002D55C8C1|nr:DUF4231 domain-containing protein [Alloacidobacterium sp.]HYK36988.1 DUF4231 domain-containing protein [Alloacidobacterium sp.]
MKRKTLFGPVDRRRAVSQRLGDPGADLAGMEADSWQEMDEEQRAKLIEYVNLRYTGYLNDLYESANICVERYDASTARYRIWRHIIIIGTGIVAIINLLAANRDHLVFWYLKGNAIPILAAIAALVLAVLANLETFYNSAEQAQAYRESRELFLDAAREFDRVWNVSVVHLGDSAKAYANAIELYKRIVAADRDLRGKFKELTKTEYKK